MNDLLFSSNKSQFNKHFKSNEMFPFFTIFYYSLFSDVWCAVLAIHIFTFFFAGVFSNFHFHSFFHQRMCIAHATAIPNKFSKLKASAWSIGNTYSNNTMWNQCTQMILLILVEIKMYFKSKDCKKSGAIQASEWFRICFHVNFYSPLSALTM